MKKRLTVVFIAVLMLLSCFAGCTTYQSIKVKGAQDTNYVVTSNGGMSVAYGNYVYFVNGYKAPEDADGKSNEWGKVEQGGIYRAELSGVSQDMTGEFTGLKSFVSDTGEETSFKQDKNQNNPFYYFNSLGEAVNDEDELIKEDTEEQRFKIDVVNVQQVISKNITCDSEGRGGLYIFDNYIYYATRNNQKDKNGNIQSSLFEFYRTKLDGSGTQKIYTTASGEKVKYRFYYQDGSVYLVVLEGTNLVSVKIGKKPAKRLIIAEDVTGAVFPEITDYYKGKNRIKDGKWDTNINDFVFFTRAATKEDFLKSGVIAEMINFDGSFREEILSNPTALALDSVRNDSLYFTETRETGTALVRQEIEKINFADKKAAEEKDRENYVNFKQVQIFGSTAGYTSMYAFRNKSANGIYDAYNSVLLISGGKLMLHNDTRPLTTILNSSVTVMNVIGDYIYFNKGDSLLYRTSFRSAEEKTKDYGAEFDKISEKTLISGTYFLPDVASGNLFYNVATLYGEWATNYTFTKRVSLNNGEKEKFIGYVEQENPSIKIHKDHKDDDLLCKK